MNRELLRKQHEALFQLDAMPAPPRQKNHQVRISIQENDMIAYAHVAAKSESCGVTEFEILSRLYAEDVSENIQFERIRDIVASRRYNEDVVVATGFQPEHGRDARLIPKLQLEEFPPEETSRKFSGGRARQGVPVEMDQVLMVKEPATPGKAGFSVRGRRIEPRPGKDIEFQVGDNVLVYKDGLRLIAGQPGLAGLEDGRVTVRDQEYDVWKYKIYTKQNKMQVLMTITPGLSKQPEHTEMWFNDIMDKHGIKFGIEKNALNLIPRNMTTTYVLTVARGEMPVAGSNAKIREAYKDGAEAHQVLFKVQKDQLIAEKIPAGKGGPGRNVMDEKVPAPDGKDITLAAGANTLLSDDGLKVFATTGGYVSRDREGAFTIVPCMEYGAETRNLPRQVNYEGTVLVTGDVPRGYSIVAGHHVEIRGKLTGADVVAGGDLHVHGRILDCSKNRVQCGGDMYVGGAQNARLRSEKNIYLGETATGCELIAGGGVFKYNGFPGVLRGGRLIAAAGVDLDVLGDASGAPTLIFTGANLKLRMRYENAAREMVQLVAQLKAVAQELYRLTKLLKEHHISQQELERYKRVQFHHKVLREKVQRGKAALSALEQKIASGARTAGVFVNQNVHPGVTVKIGSQALKVDKAKARCAFNLSADAASVAVREFE